MILCGKSIKKDGLCNLDLFTHTHRVVIVNKTVHLAHCNSGILGPASIRLQCLLEREKRKVKHNLLCVLYHGEMFSAHLHCKNEMSEL